MTDHRTQYRKKPIVVDAEQFFGIPIHGVMWDSSHKPYVVTKQRQHVYISDGEWVIREADGSGFYPCAAETFANTYEPVVPEFPKYPQD